MKVCLNYCILDNNDGSYSISLFKTEEGARGRDAFEFDHFGATPEESVGTLNFEIDDGGNLVSGYDWVRLDEEDNEIYEG